MVESIRAGVRRCVLFDWGDTLMRNFPQYPGPMASWPQVEALPGAVEVLEQLHPTWLVGLATNAQDSDEAEIRAALQRAGLNRWIDRVYCFRGVGARKPSLEFYTFVLQDLNLASSAVVMVGDDLQADVLGGLDAGLWAVWLHSEPAGEAQSGPFRSVRTLHELPGVLEELVKYQ